MVNNEVDTVVLIKTSYDNMRGTNYRASMPLREIMDSMSIANDCNDLSIDLNDRASMLLREIMDSRVSQTTVTI